MLISDASFQEAQKTAIMRAKLGVVRGISAWRAGGASMSDYDRPERRRFSFVEFYFGAKVISGLIGLGLAVIFWAELLRPKDAPHPMWLSALEYIYVMGFAAIVMVVSWALGITVPKDITIECAYAPAYYGAKGEQVMPLHKGDVVKDAKEVKNGSGIGFYQGTIMSNGAPMTVYVQVTDAEANCRAEPDKSPAK
jgi:hypothetical protein